MNPSSAALLEQPAMWPTPVAVALATVAVAGVAVATVAAEAAPGEWACPGVGFDEDGDGVDEVGVALAGSYSETFARQRKIDADLVHLASISLELAEASASIGTGARVAARRADRDVADSIAEIGLISIHEALRICRVARGITERTTLLGEQLPAPYERVREAFGALSIPMDSAHAIIVALDEAGTRAHVLVGADADADAEMLENFAVPRTPSTVATVRVLAARWRDALDVDGVEPREKALTKLTSLHRFVRANGMKRYVLDADPIAAAYLDAVIDGHVGATIRRPRFDGAEASGTGSAGADSAGADMLENTRSLEQVAAESIVQLARHGIACTNTEIPVRATSIVVRMSLESLITGLGAAYIDGIETPISAGTARIMAADAEIIPEVLGGNSEVLDYGASRRLFSRAQRLAITERDGGCAFPGCQSPPTHTEAHHIKWWNEGGLTNLDNAITVCSRHHHDIHRDDWGIEVIDNVPWFVPPNTIDITRTPRRGGRLPDPKLPNPPRVRWSFLPN